MCGSMGRRFGLCLVALVVMAGVRGEAQLSTTFYDTSCPHIYSVVKAEVKKAVAVEKRMAASLIRLHFHDCFVNGCDGSLLLDDAPGIDSEKLAAGNIRSARGFEVVDSIKTALEKACPRTVSCADLLAVASRDSAVEVGLVPEYPVFFGRRDNLFANVTQANLDLPTPDSTYPVLVASFAAKNLNELDLVALSGAHTIGRVRCEFVREFLNDTDISAVFRGHLAKVCPEDGDKFSLQNLDLATPDEFDNSYFRNLLRGEGILRSDQVLQSTPGPNVAWVQDFAQNQNNFFRQYALSTIKMGNIKLFSDKEGEVRVNCRVVNPSSLIAFE